MKKMKKTLCLFLALIMCLSLVNLPAFAADDPQVDQSEQITENVGVDNTPDVDETTPDVTPGTTEPADGDASNDGNNIVDGDVSNDGNNIVDGGASNDGNNIVDGGDSNGGDVSNTGDAGTTDPADGASNTDGDEGGDANVNVNGDEGGDANVNVNGDGENGDEGENAGVNVDTTPDVDNDTATAEDFFAACEAMGDADDIESTLAVLDDIEAVYNRLSDEDKAAVAEAWANVQAYREQISGDDGEDDIETLDVSTQTVYVYLKLDDGNANANIEGWTSTGSGWYKRASGNGYTFTATLPGAQEYRVQNDRPELSDTDVPYQNGFELIKKEGLYNSFVPTITGYEEGNSVLVASGGASEYDVSNAQWHLNIHMKKVADTTTTSVPVYVYLHVQNEDGSEVTGWNGNALGWYTIGKIADASSVLEPANEHPQVPDGSDYEKVFYQREKQSSVIALLDQIVRHTSNANMDIDWSAVKWNDGWYGLHTGRGATDYDESGNNTWHLDGLLTIPTQRYTLTVNYLDKATNDPVADRFVQSELTPGTYGVPMIELPTGYALDSVILTGETETALDKSNPKVTIVNKDVVVNVYYVKTIASLTVNKTASKNEVTIGEELIYTITVTNNGNTVLNQVEVTDALPDNLEMVSVPEGMSYNDQTRECCYTIASLEAGRSISLNITVKATAGASGTISNIARAEVEDGPSGEDQVDVTVKKPALSVTKTVKDAEGNEITTAKVGDTLYYTITVTNSGDAAATGVTLVDKFNGHGDLVWDTSNNPVDPTETAFNVPAKSGSEDGKVEFTATYKVLAADAGKTITNSAAENGEEPGDDGTTEVEVTKPKLTKIEKVLTGVTVNGTTVAVPTDGKLVVKKGDMVVLTYTITVTGDEGASYTVSDPGATPADSSGTLDSTGKATIQVTKTVQRAQLGTKTVENIATVTPGEGTDPEGPGPSNEVETEIIVNPKLTSIKKELVKIVVNGKEIDREKDAVKVGEDIVLTYTITVTGDKGASYTVSDPGAKFDDKGSTSVEGVLGDTGEATYTVTKTVKAEEVGTLTVENTATVEPKEGTDPCNPNSDKVETQIQVTEDGAPIEIIKSADKDKTTVNGVVNYTVRIKNKTSITKVVEFNDELPTGMVLVGDVKFAGAEKVDGSGLTGVKLTIKGYDEVVVTYQAKAEKANPNDALTNKATAKVDNKEYTAEKTVTVTDPKLDIRKTADKTTAKLGDVIIYKISVKNTGNVDLKNVVVVDDMMEKVTLAEGSSNWFIGELKVGEEQYIIYTYTVTEKDVADKKVYNGAVVKGLGENGEEPEDKDEVTVTVDDGKGIQVKKDRTSIVDAEGNLREDGYAMVGDTITWEIQVQNLSNLEKTVKLTEKLDGAKLSEDTVTLAPAGQVGNTATVTATYTVTGEETLDNGTLFNTVVGTADGKDTEGKDDGTDIYVAYSVEHRYYTDNGFTGSTTTANGTMIGKVGTPVDADTIGQQTSYGGNDYSFTRYDSASIILSLNAANNIIVLNYSRTTISGNTTEYKLNYDANGGSGAPDTQTQENNRDFTVSGGVPTREGYTFQGWSLTSNGEVQYRAGDAISIPEGQTELTLYAIWESNPRPPEEIIPDEDPPLVDLPDEDPPTTDIPDEEPPLVDIPDEEPAKVETPTEETPVPVVELPDEQVPLVELPDEQLPMIEWPPMVVIPAEDIPAEDIPDEDVPLASVPQTGDYSPVWIAALVLSISGLAVLTLKKREDEEN